MKKEEEKEKAKGVTGMRAAFMLLGILLIGICVTCYRLSEFGVDPFSGMNLGISGFIGWSFGNWQLVANILILVVVFFTVRHLIGPGTVINMVGVGYTADFLCWVVLDVLKVEMTLPLRILALCLGTLFASLGVALYMIADMGLSPYDSVALIIEKLTKGKVPFQFARVASDITVIVIGVAFCLAAGNNVWLIVGIGTIANALLNGPLIQFFRKRIEKVVDL
ncbi:YczE/YyaS/YitT family protein [Bariatricus sp. HCP28S3_C2]|uniref:YczE/YyaS/YitT family protein n=1 Tax=unclassified Bariatricus TaxID=2677046 RepID=UPI003F8B4B26